MISGIFSHGIKILLLLWTVCPIKSQGGCIDSSFKPNKTEDCIGRTNSTHLCCLLNSINTPAAYSNCISLKNERANTLITVGSMEYSINCTGVNNFQTYFPFEGDYKPCGINNANSASDCWKYNSNSPCCLASIDKSFSSNSNLLCYYYDKNPGNEILNFTAKSSNGVDLHFWCTSKYFATNFLFILLTISLLIFL
jgi:hypothetical protein